VQRVYDDILSGDITVSAGQDCKFIKGGEITDGVTVVGGSFGLNGAAVDRDLD